jgi:hypothetical protein
MVSIETVPPTEVSAADRAADPIKNQRKKPKEIAFRLKVLEGRNGRAILRKLGTHIEL